MKIKAQGTINIWKDFWKKKKKKKDEEYLVPCGKDKKTPIPHKLDKLHKQVALGLYIHTSYDSYQLALIWRWILQGAKPNISMKTPKSLTTYTTVIVNLWGSRFIHKKPLTPKQLTFKYCTKFLYKTWYITHLKTAYTSIFH